MQLFAIKDIKASSFGNPISFINRAVALRSLTEAAAVPDHMFSKHGYDYQLYFIGELDISSGAIITPPQPEFIITVGDLCQLKAAA